MDRASEIGYVKCWRLGKDKVMVSHLQFADDTIFFLEREGSSFKNLLTVLALFCSVSGLKINMSKSTIFGISVEEKMISALAESVGCEVGSWPNKYLGLPLGGNPCSKALWALVISKVAKRLDG